MLCYIILDKDAKSPLYRHPQHQIRYVIKGKLKLIPQHN